MERGSPILSREVPERSRSVARWVSDFAVADMPKRDTVCRAGDFQARLSVYSAAAEMAQVDHRAGQCFEGVMNAGDGLNARDHAAQFVFPRKHALDGTKALLVDRLAEHAFGSRPGGFSVARVLFDVGQ